MNVCMHIYIHAHTRTNMHTQNTHSTGYINTHAHAPVYSICCFSLFLHRLPHFLSFNPSIQQKSLLLPRGETQRTQMNTHTHTRTCTHKHTHTHKHTYAYLYICVYTHVCMCIYLYVYTYVYMYIYFIYYIYIYAHIYIYIHAVTYSFASSCFQTHLHQKNFWSPQEIEAKLFHVSFNLFIHVYIYIYIYIYMYIYI